MEEEKQPKSATPPEETANFQGHESDLLFERMTNPAIREQLITLMLTENKEYIASIRSGNWEERPSESEHPDPDLKLLEDKTTGRIIFAGQLTDEPKTREDIERELDETLAQVSSVTEVSFEPGSPHSHEIHLEWYLPGGKAPNVKQKTIMLAHEKGHRVRPFHGDFYDDYFRRGFDQSKVMVTEDDLEAYRSLYTEGKTMTLEEFKESLMRYLFTGNELAERMGQLKGYFGMHGDEHFSKEHLDYARTHYIEDTGMDNGMTQFFQAITSETENAFLEIINSSGI